MVTTKPTTKGSRRQSVGAQVSLPKLKVQTKRIKRFLEKREGQVVENVKTAMFVRGTNSSETNTQLMSELVSIVTFSEPLSGLIITVSTQETARNTIEEKEFSSTF